MKNLMSFISLIILVFLFSACRKDEDKAKENIKFIGRFVGDIACSNDDEITTILDITEQDNSSTKVDVLFDSEGGVLVNIPGEVSGNNITLKKVKIEDDIFLSGKGTLSGKILKVDFDIEEGLSISTCTFTGKK